MSKEKDKNVIFNFIWFCTCLMSLDPFRTVLIHFESQWHEFGVKIGDLSIQEKNKDHMKSYNDSFL